MCAGLARSRLLFEKPPQHLARAGGWQGIDEAHGARRLVLGHVLARHSNERMSQQVGTKLGLSIVQAVAAPTTPLGQAAVSALGVGAQYGVIMPFSRIHESEADIIGIDLMAKAGFNPVESINLWRKMDQASQGNHPPEFLSTHPSHDTRIQDLQERLATAQPLYQQAIAAGKKPRCVK